VLITEADVPRILAHLAEAGSGGSSGAGSGAAARPAPEAEPPGDAPRAELDEPGETDAFEG
jgi:hypothetical protein